MNLGVFAMARTSSYCAVEDVTKLLRGYDLSAYGDEEEIASRVAELLGPSRNAVERYCGRDFWWHEGETVALDGTGTDRIMLQAAGVATPAEVSAVAINGRLLGRLEWCGYAQQGVVRLTARAAWRHFPVGVQNVKVTASWGYETPPEVVGQAQAKLAAAELLAEASGEGGGVTQTRLGDYAVSYGSEGRYASAVARLVAEAQELLARYRRLGLRAV